MDSTLWQANRKIDQRKDLKSNSKIFKYLIFSRFFIYGWKHLTNEAELLQSYKQISTLTVVILLSFVIYILTNGDVIKEIRFNLVNI